MKTTEWIRRRKAESRAVATTKLLLLRLQAIAKTFSPRRCRPGLPIWVRCEEEIRVAVWVRYEEETRVAVWVCCEEERRDFGFRSFIRQVWTEYVKL
ncbi:hypothetical protein Taro_005680 [Colocasia esculenta]|uniref:Uncharacterized protein n=1 Tax=Colocasia esculenta TaxID=4460 RepID=A0A843TYF7_COLES|nr:hypothetical protein [Colocasia esculenta]